MTTWGKVVVGILAGLVLFCLLAGFLLVQSGTLEKIKGFSGGVVGLTKSAKTLENMDKKFSFTPPGDGRIPEGRLLAYIEVCRAVKPVVAPYEKWMEEHQGKQGDFKDAQEAIGMTAKFMEVLAKALQEQNMGSREFHWLERTARKALEEAREKAGTDLDRRMLAALREAAASPGLGPDERIRIEEKARAFQGEIEASAGGALSPNAELCLRHEAALKDVELGEWGRMMAGGFGQPDHGRRHRQREEAEEADEATPPAEAPPPR